MPAALMRDHLDNATLLRLVANDLDEIGEAKARKHLRSCAPCQRSLAEVRRLDEALREHGDQLLAPGADAVSFGDDDPFRVRPEGSVRSASKLGLQTPEFAASCVAASRASHGTRERLLGAARASGDASRRALAALRLDELADRYALGHALDEALREMVEGPAKWLDLSAAAVERLASEAAAPPDGLADAEVSEAEFAYPLSELLGRAHLLAGAACNWTGAYEAGGRSLRTSYEAFGRASADPTALALVELHEAQRRAFLDELPAARQALTLADRAERTLNAYALPDQAARALGAKGIALSYLGREEEALAAFRAALPTLVEHGLWNAYVSTLNNAGDALVRLGRPDEAYREYARALRKVSRTERPAVYAFLRYNLAMTHFRAGDYAQAARAFVPAIKLFQGQGAVADALVATLSLVESHARAGATASALRLLDVLREEVERHDALDPSTVAELQRLLAGDRTDFERLAALREDAEDTVRARVRRTAS